MADNSITREEWKDLLLYAPSGPSVFLGILLSGTFAAAGLGNLGRGDAMLSVKYFGVAAATLWATMIFLDVAKYPEPDRPSLDFTVRTIHSGKKTSCHITC